MKWQPIATAPMPIGEDGECWLLGWHPNWDWPVPIYWFANGWTTPDQAVSSYGEAAEGWYRILPTHWCEIPPPPQGDD